MLQSLNGTSQVFSRPSVLVRPSLCSSSQVKYSNSGTQKPLLLVAMHFGRRMFKSSMPIEIQETGAAAYLKILRSHFRGRIARSVGSPDEHSVLTNATPGARAGSC